MSSTIFVYLADIHSYKTAADERSPLLRLGAISEHTSAGLRRFVRLSHGVGVDAARRPRPRAEERAA